MRLMITFRIPMDTGNAAIKDGSLPQTIQSILEDLKPEAAYFGDIEGARGGYLVVNMDDASQMPALSEPLFLGLGADRTSPSRDGPRGPGEGGARLAASSAEIRLEEQRIRRIEVPLASLDVEASSIHPGAWKGDSPYFACTGF